MTSSTTRTRTARPSDPAKKAAPKEPEVGPSGKKVSPEGITVQYEEITPEVARAMLEKNTENRALREGRILALERDIRSGKFFHTHQGVAFNAEGLVWVGRHQPRWHLLAAAPRKGADGPGRVAEVIDYALAWRGRIEEGRQKLE